MKKKILVCDDDKGISEVIKIILENQGYAVKVLDSSVKIQKSVQDYSPNLIFLDLWMPGVDGRYIAKMLKKDEETKNIPLIIISALNETERIAKRIGADDFLSKPFNLDELVEKVQRNLEKRL